MDPIFVFVVQNLSFFIEVAVSNRFLQNGPSVEPEQVEALRNALSSAMPVKVALTNYRRDGTPFKNLLPMKPIFDSEGNYR